MLIAFGFANMNTGGRRRIAHVLRQLARTPRFGPMQLMNDNRTVSGVNMGHLFREQELIKEELSALLRAYELEQIRPHVFRAYPFSRASEAHAELEAGKSVGKIVLVPD